MSAVPNARAKSPSAARIAALELQITKLEKINKALADRVERSMDAQGSAFSLFQTAIMLETKVRERTVELERTLAVLERSYREIAEAKEQAETAQTRLMAAIDAISEGFSLFDAQDRLVLFNRRYLSFWPGMSDKIRTGMLFREIAELAVERKAVIDAYRDPQGWVERRLAQHADPQGPSVHALSDGRWMQINEKHTVDGGVACIYTDITELKQREALQRETELAEKSNLLQATLDNIFESVAVYDRNLILVAWNNEFIRLFDLPGQVVRRSAVFRDFTTYICGRGVHGIDLSGRLEPRNNAPLKFEVQWLGQRILEVQRNPMPNGGFVLTFDDITQRKRIEEALRDGERRIRLITDAMPALISYVDADERYQFVNEPYRSWVGLPEQKIVGHRMSEVLTPEFYDRRRSYVQQALSGETVTFEVELTPSGAPQPSYGLATLVPHVGDDRKILGFFTLLQDITERRQIEGALKDAKETLERRVEERTAALTLLNETLQREIAERREIEAALQTAKSEAEGANLGKTKFLAAASHDLLQPLNAARLFVSALSDRPQDQQNRVLVDNVDESLGAVEDLLDTLLDISKLDAGAVSPEISDFDVSALLAPLTTEYTVLARERGLEFRSVPSSCILRSDVKLLRRIIQNFLSNAIRYTAAGRVVLGSRRTASGLRIEVWDTGPGIPAGKLDEIFEEFRQLHNARSGRDRGIGLGLAIVKRIAKMLGTSVAVRSQVGRGSVFSVTVPFGQAPLALARGAARPAPDLGLSQSVVLVIDNEQSILTGMNALLSGWNCRVYSATSGDEALQVLPGLPAPPDIVIADYHLDDGVSGVTELQRISRACGRVLPGIIITANRTQEAQEIARRHGYRLLNKPVKPAQLRSLMIQLIG
ncbi:MAG TPA: NahK/ErcS family hybrid sensor histidine kinase/response regulator [Alphaproteobacteria bacterium]|nr:NahK/ErcS family hybrid sensor histidine kinase/response regulator [Alphaproteobacteria bacterium]